MRYNKIPIVFGFDNNYALAGAIAISSLVRSANKSTFYEIFILSDISVSNFVRDKIDKAATHNGNCSITWIDIDDNAFHGAPTSNNWPTSVYYRLLIPKLFTQFDKIIWSDVDVIFEKDLHGIYSLNIDNNHWAGVAAEYNDKAICHQSYNENVNNIIFMSGFMVINLKKKRKDNIVDVFFENIKKYSHRLKMFDLEILNLSCNSIKQLPLEFCVLENIYYSDNINTAPEYIWLKNLYTDEQITAAKDNPSIIHFAGTEVKVWNRPDDQTPENYLEYKKLFKYDLALVNVHIGDTDLSGSRFNGHDLHIKMRERFGITSQHLVVDKRSNDSETYVLHRDTTPFSKKLFSDYIFLNADIVHLHLIHNTDFNLLHLPLLSQMKPIVWTLHDPWSLGGHCVHHGGCTKWQTHCSTCSHLDYHIPLNNDISTLEFEIKRQAIQGAMLHGIVASKWMLEKVRMSPIWKNKPVHLVPFGVNQAIFCPGDAELAKKALGLSPESLVLFTRTQKYFKGLEVLKNALQALGSTRSVVVISVGETGLLKGLPSAITHKDLGWIDDSSLLVKLFQACDIFLMPSEQEAFGMMAIEAMSCGKTVLALDTSSSALPAVIDSPRCGLAAPNERYASELIHLCTSPDELLKRGEASLEYARKHYKLETYLDNIFAVYQEAFRRFAPTETGARLCEELRKDAIMPLHSNQRFSYNKIIKNYLARIKRYYTEHGLQQTFFKIGDKVTKKLHRKFSIY